MSDSLIDQLKKLQGMNDNQKLEQGSIVYPLIPIEVRQSLEQGGIPAGYEDRFMTILNDNAVPLSTEEHIATLLFRYAVKWKLHQQKIKFAN